MPKEVTQVTPTPERMRRGVELIDRAIADEDGRPSQPYRSIDILAALERRGAINAEMRTAGEEFQELFRLAQLDPLKAADMSRPYVDSFGNIPAIGSRIEKARESVWKTILTLGGSNAPGASCIWHVLGWGMTLSEWAIEQGWRGKRVSPAAAPMVLITALGVLAKPPHS
jgi:hypothetical protein